MVKSGRKPLYYITPEHPFEHIECSLNVIRNGRIIHVTGEVVNYRTILSGCIFNFIMWQAKWYHGRIRLCIPYWNAGRFFIISFHV